MAWAPTQSESAFFCQTFRNGNQAVLAIQYQEGWNVWLWESRHDDWLSIGTIPTPAPGLSRSWSATQARVLDWLEEHR